MNRIKKIRSHVGRILIGLVLASVVGGSALPALGDDHRRPYPPDRYRYEHPGRGRDAYYYHRRVYRPYVHRHLVYAPPPAFFVPPPPPPPPGIHIFFPPIIIR